MVTPVQARTGSPAARVLFASMIGTTIEFFDFYIYATAAVLVFPKLFFPKSDPATASLQAFATFALAFIARPVGSALFGHFGDRIGRKATLVSALLTMGLSTVLIGLLPTYSSIGVAAAALLCLCRLGQGLGLGGEWGGAVLLATENAPPGSHAWYGSFPQQGAPAGYFCSTAVFLLLAYGLDDAQFLAWGWRVPFLASAVLVIVGLYIRLRLVETPAFQRVLDQGERVRVPVLVVLKRHAPQLIVGIFATTTTFTIFYLMAVFSLSWATGSLGYPRKDFLILELVTVPLFAATIPLSGLIADRIGGRAMMIVASVALFLFGFAFAPLFVSGSRISVFAFLALGFALTGLTYGPIGSFLATLYPTEVRYTGTSLTFNFAGILGASVAPSIALWLAKDHGIAWVGYYLSAGSAVSLLALLALKPAYLPAAPPRP